MVLDLSRTIQYIVFGGTFRSSRLFIRPATRLTVSRTNRSLRVKYSGVRNTYKLIVQVCVRTFV